MEEGLKIKIGADVGEAVKGIKEVDTALKTLTPQTRAAGNALTNLGRIASDAPFSVLSGNLIAVSNNIDPLITSFRALRAESKSVGGAFRALLSSLGGGGGIALAFSVATAAITLFSAKASESSKATKELKDGTKELTGAIADEASRTAVLVQALQSDTLSREQKKGALEELKRINPDYFGQLKEEEGLVKGLAAAYAAYVANLSTQFKAKALDKQLAELFDKKVQLEAQVDIRPKTFTPDDLRRIAAIQKQIDALGIKELDPNKRIDQLTDAEKKFIELKRIMDGIGKSNTFDFTGTSQELTDVNKQIDALLIKRTALGNFDIKQGKEGKEGKEKEVDLLQQQIDLYEELAKKVGLLRSEQEDLVRLRLTKLDRDSSNLNASQIERLRESILKDLPTGGSLVIPVTIKPTIDTTQALPKDDRIPQVKANLVEVKDETLALANTLTNTLAPAFTSAFDSILSGSRSALQAFGDIIKSIIKKLAEAAIQAAIFAGIMSAFGGGSFGSLFGKNFGSALGFSGGFGGGAGRGAAWAGGGGQLTTSVSGQDLQIVLDRTGRSNGRYG